MPNYIIHDEEGRIHDPCRTCSEVQIDGQLGEGQTAILVPEGIEVDPKLHRVIDGEVVDHIEQPGALETLIAADNAARTLRSARLAEVDWLINRAEDAGKAAYVSALRSHRQALRDITNQAEFPISITWPALPAETN